MEFSQIATGTHLEGLALDGDTVWYTDVLGGGVHRISAEEGTDVWRDGEPWIGGVMLNADGKVLSSGADGISWFDPETGASGVLIKEVDGRPLTGVNEMAADTSGGIVFGTVDIAAFKKKEAPGPCALYRLDPEGHVTQLCDGLKFTNGLAFSADMKQLYHNETFVGTIAYDVDENGLLGTPRKLLDKADCDGLKVDVQGRIWVAGFQSDHIIILRPDGTVDGTFALPAKGATNLCFGGQDGKDLYVTGLDTVAKADDPSDIKMGGERKSTLYRMRASLAGLPVLRPHLKC